MVFLVPPGRAEHVDQVMGHPGDETSNKLRLRKRECRYQRSLGKVFMKSFV